MKKITLIGIGKLGLGLALLIEKSGYDVIGVDIFPNYVKVLNDKSFESSEPGYNDLIQNSKNFRATTDLQEGLNYSDIIFIIVQTPNGGGDKFYDHSILSNLLENINNRKIENKHLIIGCTVMPKYIDEIGKYLISDCKNTTLSYNPEFIAQGDIVHGFENPDIILIGSESEELVNELKELYDKITLNEPTYCILTPIESEIVKIGINGFITTKLSYANMISDLCDNLGANKKDVLRSIGGDKRIGNKYFRPGYSFGGPCFPRDTKALALLMKQNNINDTLLISTSEYNEDHIKFQAEQLLKENKHIYEFTNVCYKEDSDIPIIEESAKLKIAMYLYKNGKDIIIKDKKNIINEVKKEFGKKFRYEILN